jgi:hypothetical protein
MIAPAAMITSFLAWAVKRVPFGAANSTPDATSGMLVLDQVIFVT